jgi:signal peptidase I
MKVNIRQILVTVLIIVVIFLGMHYSLQSYTVSGSSMEPSFVNGEWLLVDKLSYHFSSPKRGNVVILNPPLDSSEPYIKRIVGLPGEHIEIKEGKIYIDGKELEETPDLPAIKYSDKYSVDIPEDYYFVLGDNRPVSGDSRIFGPIPEKNIVGKVWIRYWPPSEWGLSPSYSATLE